MAEKIKIKESEHNFLVAGGNFVDLNNLVLWKTWITGAPFCFSDQRKKKKETKLAKGYKGVKQVCLKGGSLSWNWYVYVRIL